MPLQQLASFFIVFDFQITCRIYFVYILQLFGGTSLAPFHFTNGGVQSSFDTDDESGKWFS